MNYLIYTNRLCNLVRKLPNGFLKSFPLRCHHKPQMPLGRMPFRVARDISQHCCPAFFLHARFEHFIMRRAADSVKNDPCNAHVGVKLLEPQHNRPCALLYVDLDNLLQIIVGALSVATRRARIVTPYFLPDSVLLRAVQVAALRGVEVDIVLPGRSNVPLMDWAMTPQLPELMEKGCRIYLAPPPFDHTKLFVVDGTWSLIGSTNWDARSLRLNFEYNLECYDRTLAAQRDAVVDDKIAGARLMTRAELEGRSFAVKLRDGLTRLLSPYL